MADPLGPPPVQRIVTGPTVQTPRGFAFSPDGVRAWIEAEMRCYLSGDLSNWNKKGSKNGRDVFKLDRKKLGAPPTALPIFALHSVLPFTVDQVVDYTHTRFIENSPKWTPTFKGGEVIERLSGPQAYGVADQICVNYVAHKLPLVNDRDFLYFTFVRRISAPNPSLAAARNPTPTNCWMFFNVSTNTGNVPVPAGMTRGEIVRSVTAVHELPGQPGVCSYFWMQELDVKGKIPKKLVSADQVDQMIKQNENLARAIQAGAGAPPGGSPAQPR